MIQDVLKLQCKVCGASWFRRSEKLPKTCPKCGSTYWREGRKRPPRAEQLAKSRQRKLEDATEILKHLTRAEARRVVPSLLAIQSVMLREVMVIPCGEIHSIEECLNNMGEGNEVEVSGQLALMATANSFVARTSGMSMSREGWPDGIGPDSRVLLIPLNEYKGELYPGIVVLVKLKYQCGTIYCTLKEWHGTRIKARNPRFEPVEFGPNVAEASVWAVCAGVVEKVLLRDKGAKR